MTMEEHQPRLKDEITQAVRLALLEEKQADHESRIKSLESFRWWLMSSAVAAALSSSATLLVLLLHNK